MAHIGRCNQLGIAIEETPGTPKEPTHYIPFIDCTLVERHTPISDSQAKGIRDAEGNDSVEGKKWGEGTIKVVLDPTTAPYWLALALGNIDSTGAPTHLVTQGASSDPLTATIWRGRVVDSVEFANSVVDTLELNFADDVATLTAKIFSKYPTDEERNPTETELQYYTFRNATVRIGNLESPESPESWPVYKIRELTLTINNEAEMIYAPGSNDVDRIVWKGLRVTGNFKILFENETQKSAFANLEKQGMLITFSGEGSDKIEILIPRFRVDNWNLETPIDDLAQEGIDFVAEYDDGEGCTIKAEVTNEVAEYITT